jgi:hypothetical protein
VYRCQSNFLRQHLRAARAQRLLRRDTMKALWHLGCHVVGRHRDLASAVVFQPSRDGELRLVASLKLPGAEGHNGGTDLGRGDRLMSTLEAAPDFCSAASAGDTSSSPTFRVRSWMAL